MEITFLNLKYHLQKKMLKLLSSLPELSMSLFQTLLKTLKLLMSSTLSKKIFLDRLLLTRPRLLSYFRIDLLELLFRFFLLSLSLLLLLLLTLLTLK